MSVSARIEVTDLSSFPDETKIVVRGGPAGHEEGRGLVVTTLGKLRKHPAVFRQVPQPRTLFLPGGVASRAGKKPGSKPRLD
jgi:hypothetical protein